MQQVAVRRQSKTVRENVACRAGTVTGLLGIVWITLLRFG